MRTLSPLPPDERPRLTALGLARLLPGVLIVAAGVWWAWLHVPALAAESFWTDELISVGDATYDLIRMLKIQGADIHPPLHTFLLWLLQRLTQSASETTMRLPSLVAVASGMTILGLAAWRRLGAWPALVFMVLAMSSPLLAGFAGQARPHPLSFGFVCLATSAWLFLLRPGRPDRRLLAGFGLAGMLASLSQHYGALAFGLEAVVVVGWLALQARSRGAAGPGAAPARVGWADVRTAVGVAGLAVLPLVVWLVATRQWTHGSATPPLTLTWAEAVVSWMLEPWSNAAFSWPNEAPRSIRAMAELLLVATTLLGAGLLLHRRDATGLRDRIAVGAVALGLAGIAVGLAIAQSLVGSPTFHNRSVLSLMPLFQLGLAVALTLPFGRLAPVAALSLALGLGAVATGTDQVSLYGPLDQWREAAGLIRDEQRTGLAADRIAVWEPYEQYDWLVSLGNAYGLPAPVTAVPPELRGLRWIAGTPDIAAVPKGQPLLLVAFHYYSFDAQAAILAATQARFGPCQDRSVRGITILRCTGGRPGS